VSKKTKTCVSGQFSVSQSLKLLSGVLPVESACKFRLF
jgi:hypothetical protein